MFVTFHCFELLKPCEKSKLLRVIHEQPLPTTRRHLTWKKSASEVFFLLTFFFNITLAFYSTFINEICWEQKDEDRILKERKRWSERSSKGRNKKPTDNKQHNFDLKGDFQSSKCIETREKMKRKEPKACFSWKQLFGVRKPQSEQYLKGLNEGS